MLRMNDPKRVRAVSPTSISTPGTSDETSILLINDMAGYGKVALF